MQGIAKFSPCKCTDILFMNNIWKLYIGHDATERQNRSTEGYCISEEFYKKLYSIIPMKSNYIIILSFIFVRWNGLSNKRSHTISLDVVHNFKSNVLIFTLAVL